ncbi:MAG: RNA methyltransferase [Bacteroidota bacterium]
MRKLSNEELDRLDVASFKKASKIPLLLILDNVRSLHNIGSVFRTADAFLVEKIYLCGITAKPPHKDIHKTALGATESVAWEYWENTLDLVTTLEQQGVIISAVEQAEGSVMLNNFNILPHQTHAFVFGHEVKGVAQEVVSACHHVVEIPQFGTKHSLNVSVSAGLAIWEFWTRWQQTP